MEIVADEPVFEVGLLMAGESEPADLRKQLSRWRTGSNRKLWNRISRPLPIGR